MYKILIFVQRLDALSRGFETNLDILEGWGCCRVRWVEDIDSAEQSPQPLSQVGTQPSPLSHPLLWSLAFVFSNSCKLLVGTRKTLLYRGLSWLTSIPCWVVLPKLSFCLESTFANKMFGKCLQSLLCRVLCFLKPVFQKYHHACSGWVSSFSFCSCSLYLQLKFRVKSAKLGWRLLFFKPT